MKTIINLLKGCSTNAELCACIICLVVGYVFIAMLFWQIHWMCGIMSVYMTTSLLRAWCRVVKYLEQESDE